MLFKCWFSIFKAQTVKPLQSWVPLWAQEWFLQLTGDPEASQEFHQTPKPSYCLQGSKSLNEYSSYRPKNQVPKAPNVTTRATSLPWTCLLSSTVPAERWFPDKPPDRQQGTLHCKALWKWEVVLEITALNCFQSIQHRYWFQITLQIPPPSSQFSNVMHRNQSGAFPNGQIINYSIHFPHKNNNSFM